MDRKNLLHYNSVIIENSLPLGNEGRKYLGIVLQQAYSLGMNIEKQEKNKLIVSVYTSCNIQNNGTVLFKFQMGKRFEILEELEQGEMIHLCCDLLTIAAHEHYLNLAPIECSLTRTEPEYKPNFKDLYPIATEAYNRFLQGVQRNIPLN